MMHLIFIWLQHIWEAGFVCKSFVISKLNNLCTINIFVVLRVASIEHERIQSLYLNMINHASLIDRYYTSTQGKRLKFFF